MSQTLRIALAQIDTHVGAVAKNTQKVIDWSIKARDELGADLVIFPELTLVGYPPEDLLWRPGLRKAVEQAIDTILAEVSGIDIMLGYPEWHDEKIYNTAALFHDGEIQATYYKHALPNYAVFDEKRYFAIGSEACVIEKKGIKLGLTICEDLWVKEPAQVAKNAGAELLLNISASPWNMGKFEARAKAFGQRASETILPIVAVNLVGGQDELVFDGSSFVLDSDGKPVCFMNSFEEQLAVLEVHKQDAQLVLTSDTFATEKPLLEYVYQALVMGVRDYITKNGFIGVVIGLSGGVDSALTLVIAADALGPENVEAVMLPSRYTRDMSLEDAEALANNMGVDYGVIPIESVFNSFVELLADEFQGMETDVTEENIQARCRGIILMAISNKKGKMLLTTGNKSEMAMGYSTLYGDMAGGFNPLKDVSKTMVFALCRHRNLRSPDIPERIITRPPSAELRADQEDADSLPPYDILDAILERYVEQDISVEDIIAEGYDEAVVRRVVRLLDINEHKRRQAPPGVRITPRAFGKDRRYPITSGY
jgi:NAD+ synthase (glutamine-hydrolysing)